MTQLRIERADGMPDLEKDGFIFALRRFSDEQIGRVTDPKSYHDYIEQLRLGARATLINRLSPADQISGMVTTIEARINKSAVSITTTTKIPEVGTIETTVTDSYVEGAGGGSEALYAPAVKLGDHVSRGLKALGEARKAIAYYEATHIPKIQR